VDDNENPDDAPEITLWAALVIAPPEGTTVPDLMAETGMSRPWVYLRLRELTDQGQVTQVSRGRWRAVPTDPP
jgi:S-DNA-T family DNA segregation ATPase FtsK/SpoIIIE